MTDVDLTDRGFTRLEWYETHNTDEYEAYHAGAHYSIRLDPSYGYGGLYSLLVTRRNGRKIHRLYKTLGAAKGGATKLAQRLQWLDR